MTMRAAKHALGGAAGVMVGLLALPVGARAAEATAASTLSGADTAFVLVSAALVMLMTPGLGLFYGGMVRGKNVLATFQQSFIMLGLITLQWTLVGYSLAFGPDVGGWGLVGNPVTYAGLRLEAHPIYTTIPHQAFMVFQLMFAIITPALISGAFAERMKFSAYLAFTLLWATLVYDPVAHWVWGGGWVGSRLGAIDFAGGLVVHLISGIAALCCVLVMGKRKGHGQEEMHPHNLTMTALGTGLLWFGWFGFNAGSALAASPSAVAAFVNTNTAAATAAFAWAAVEWWHKGKATVLGACTGAVAGLVAITPCAGYVVPMGAIAVGIIVTLVCYGAILLKSKLGYDDSLDVFGVHGVGGLTGALLVGVFATTAMTRAAGINVVAGTAQGVAGLIEGSAGLLVSQALSVVAAGLYSFVLTFVILKLVDMTIGLRVTADEEEVGLDLTQHGERGYIMGIGELMGGGHGLGRQDPLPPLSELASRPIAEMHVGV
jgi:Amt family ammonium transporter